MEDLELIEALERLLPQTQCTRCSYPGCRPYAEAIVAGEAGINRCPPGGKAGIAKLAALLGRPALPLDPACGVEQPLQAASIDETRCIGCAICMEACPVDAIIGAAKQMHTVLEAVCTGCELCVAPCPVDCISLVPARDPEWTRQRAEAARRRFEARKARLVRNEAERSRRLAERASAFEMLQGGP